MEGSDRDRQYDVGEIIKRVREDASPYSPEARAHRVLQVLLAHPQFTPWDLLCFAAEYTGSLAGNFDFLQAPAKELLRSVYLAHYVQTEVSECLDKSTLGAEAPSSDLVIERTSEPTV